MENFSFLSLFIFFIISAAITWQAGVALTKTTSTLDTRFNLGDAMGGLILLGISGSLPEIAVCLSAARDGHIQVIIGNLFGGLTIQTLLLVIFDLTTRRKKPLSYLAGSRILSLETFFPIVITMVALLATRIPAKDNIFNINPLSISILIFWLGGIFFINKARKIKKLGETAEEALPGRRHFDRRQAENHPFYNKKSSGYVIFIFLLASVFTLIAGFILERSGSAIAGRLGLSTGLFAAIVISFVTSLPEISTGLKSIFIGDHHLAVSDIMGGNAFMLTIFLMADIVSQSPILSYANRSDIFFAVLGITMMGIYAVSFLVRSPRQYFRLGIDSILEVAVYAVGIFSLVNFII